MKTHQEFFTTGSTGRQIFQHIINKNRFAVILNCVQFDDPHDKNKIFRQFWHSIIQLISKFYNAPIACKKLAKNHGLTALQYHFLFNAYICAGSDGKILNDQEKKKWHSKHIVYLNTFKLLIEMLQQAIGSLVLT